MNRYLKIQDNLFLVQEEITVKEAKEDSGPTNHIFIYDRSGSMSGLLKSLTEDLIQRCKQIPVGSTISIGWFSSENNFNFILKGFRISAENDYNILENAIRKNNTTIGLTCFSEILNETADNVINDLSVFSDRFALTFFTDGYPVVSNYNKEKQDIFKAIEKLEKVLTGSLLVGYGNYYNKELMSEMAEQLGGCLVHSSDLPSFGIAVDDFITSVKTADNKIEVLVSEKRGDIYFGINDSNVNIYTPREGIIKFAPTKKGKNYLYSIVSTEPSNAELVKLSDGEVGKNTKIEAFIKGVYAAAYILVQKTKIGNCLEVLNKLGDKAIVDVVANSFTNDEYGKAEKRIADCVKSANKRFLKGRDVNYLPAKDAFCVLDLIDLLCNDRDAYFYPRHEGFVYNKIGISSVPKDGYPEFIVDKDNKCSFSQIVWNKDKLNLSVLMKLNGVVKLKKDYKKFGFTFNMFPTFVWRNYTIVRDGFKNVKAIPVSFSEQTFDKLKTEGLINENEKYSDKVYVLDLANIPVMNASIAENNTSAKQLFELSWLSLNQKASLKVYKYLRDVLSPEKQVSEFDGWNEKQVQYLNDLCITEKGYSPPVDKIEPTDFYYTKEFKISIKKFSSLPKVTDVLTKMKNKKPLTASEELFTMPLARYNEIGKNQLEWLDKNIKELTKENRAVDSNIQRIKFAVVLGNQWFYEFDNRDECDMELNGVMFSIKLDTKKVEV